MKAAAWTLLAVAVMLAVGGVVYGLIVNDVQQVMVGVGVESVGLILLVVALHAVIEG